MGEGEIPSRDRYIDAVFESGGYLSRVFPGYKPRAGQVALARAVDHSIAERTHLLAEGPTGTGKSLAYAVPASYYAWSTGRPVVIVTANIALQEQIVNKDLPLLQSIAPWPFTFALMKGRNNYLCEDKRATFAANKFANYGQGGFGFERSEEERRQLKIVGDWADECHAAGPLEESGDVSDLPFVPMPHVWKNFSVSADECKKNHCKFRDGCFANAAFDRARTAKVVVTNYHLLFAHLSVFLSTGIDIVLPPFEVAVLDEAHKAADIARDFFGFKITQEVCKRLGRKIGREDARVQEAIDRGSTYFFHSMLNLRHDPKRYKARITGDFIFDETDSWSQLKDALGAACGIFELRCQKASAAYEAIRTNGGGLSKEADDALDEVGEAERDRDRCLEVSGQLAQAMDPRNNLSNVFFLEEDEKGRVTVSSKLIYASEVLEPALFNKEARSRGPDGSTIIGNPVTVICTSATLATNGTSFDYVAAEMGVPKGYHELVAQSPFDWPRQCLFIVPSDMPNPQDEEFKDAVARTVEKTVLLAGGRTLALFTSNRVLNHTYDTIVGACRRNRITLLKQGDAPRMKLIEQFKADVSSVLLGTESFWAGVDVPGEACSVVIIDRLPFPTPDDPVLDVLSAADDKWFFRYSVPRAMIAFKQGFGRLIRSTSDKGVVVCLDQRLATKRYGRDFLRSLPPVPKSTRLEALVDWLKQPLPMEEAWDAL
jgi:ATP-dependent DNA helicase DinG